MEDIVRIKASVRVPCEEFAEKLASLSSKSQATVINKLASEIKARCDGKEDAQICWIADDIDSNGREFVNALAEFIKLRDEGE
jgi:hypothetical protein